MKTAAILLTLASGACWYFFSQTLWQVEKKTYCGFIKWKLEEPQHSKYRSWQEPMFVIKFDGVEEPHELRPTWDDFMTMKQGDRVCYTLSRGVVESEGHGDFIAFGILGLILGIFAFAFIYGIVIEYITEREQKDERRH